MDSPPLPPIRSAFWLAATLCWIVTYVWMSAPFLSQINDDAYITFRYARHLAEGAGPYFNPGEHVEGYTSFLFMGLVAAWIRLVGPADPLPFARVCGLIGGTLAILAVVRLTTLLLKSYNVSEPCRFIAAALAGFWIALHGAIAINSTTGLETTLFGGLICAALVAILSSWKHRGLFMGLFVGLACWTRPEGVVPLFCMALWLLLTYRMRDRRSNCGYFVGCLVAVAFVAGQLLLRRFLYDGEIVPNTYFAKVGGMPTITPFAYFRGLAREFYGGDLPGLIILVILPLLPLVPPLTWPRKSQATTPVASASDADGMDSENGKEIPCATPALYPSWATALPLLVWFSAFAVLWWTGADWMPGYRLMVPYLSIACSLAICGILLVGRGRSDGSMTPRLAIAALTVGLFFLFQYPAVTKLIRESRIRAEGYRRGHLALADWLNSHAQKGNAVALMDIGLVGYFCDRLRILDITGLTDRFIAKSPGPFLLKKYDPAYILDQRPEFIVLTFYGHARIREIGDMQGVEGLGHFTSIEAHLFDHSVFQSRYARPRLPESGTTRIERITALLGADRIFVHDYPDGADYLLALYVLKPEQP